MGDCDSLNYERNLPTYFNARKKLSSSNEDVEFWQFFSTDFEPLCHCLLDKIVGTPTID